MKFRTPTKVIKEGRKKNKCIQIRLEPVIYQHLLEVSAKEERSMAWIGNRAIREWLERYPQGE